MVLEKKIKFKVKVGISITGSTEHLVDVPVEGNDIDDILSSVSRYLYLEYTRSDLDNIIIDKGLNICIYAEQEDFK